MSFWDMASKAGSVVEKELYKKQNEIEKQMKRKLRQMSDAEVERVYTNRYNNSKLTSRGLELIEEEADRRGIA